MKRLFKTATGRRKMQTKKQTDGCIHGCWLLRLACSTDLIPQHLLSLCSLFSCPNNFSFFSFISHSAHNYSSLIVPRLRPFLGIHLVSSLTVIFCGITKNASPIIHQLHCSIVVTSHTHHFHFLVFHVIFNLSERCVVMSNGLPPL